MNDEKMEFMLLHEDPISWFEDLIDFSLKCQKNDLKFLLYDLRFMPPKIVATKAHNYPEVFITPTPLERFSLGAWEFNFARFELNISFKGYIIYQFTFSPKRQSWEADLKRARVDFQRWLKQIYSAYYILQDIEDWDFLGSIKCEVDSGFTNLAHVVLPKFLAFPKTLDFESQFHTFLEDLAFQTDYPLRRGFWFSKEKSHTILISTVIRFSKQDKLDLVQTKVRSNVAVTMELDIYKQIDIISRIFGPINQVRKKVVKHMLT